MNQSWGKARTLGQMSQGRIPATTFKDSFILLSYGWGSKENITASDPIFPKIMHYLVRFEMYGIATLS